MEREKENAQHDQVKINLHETAGNGRGGYSNQQYTPSNETENTSKQLFQNFSKNVIYIY